MYELQQAEADAEQLRGLRSETMQAAAPAQSAELPFPARPVGPAPAALDPRLGAPMLMQLQRMAGNRAAAMFAGGGGPVVQRRKPPAGTSGPAASASTTTGPTPATAPSEAATPTAAGPAVDGATPPVATASTSANAAPATPPAPSAAPTTSPASGSPTAVPTPADPARPAAEIALDADVEQAMNDREDPRVAADLERALGQADAFRLSSLQYSYTPSGWWKTAKQTLTQSDAFTEHARNIGSDNAYASGGLMGRVQSVIDGLRGVIRIIGDVAQVVASIAAVVALIGLAFSWTGVGAAVAAVAADVALIGSLVKIVTDLLDLVLGALQAFIVILRIRATSDPGQRARLAALLKKETSEFSQLLVAIGVQAVFMAAGAGVGAAISRDLSGSGMLKALFGPLHPEGKFATTMMREAAQTGAAAARSPVVHGGSWLFGGYAATMTFADWATQTSEQAARAAAIASIERSLAANRLGAGAGAGLAALQTAGQTAGKVNPAGSAASSPGGLDVRRPVDVSLANVSAWPEGRIQMGELRGRIANASIRMKDQYELARTDVTEADRAQLDQAIGTVETRNGKTRADALAKQQEAADQQLQLDRATAQAQRAGQSTDQAKAKQTEARQHQEAANRRAANVQPKTDDSVLGSAFAAVGGQISKFQNWVGTLAGHFVAWAAGLDEGERQMAGLPSGLSDDKVTEQKAAADAKEAETHSAAVDAQIAAIKTNKSTFEQAAIQANYDTMRWLNQLDDVDTSVQTTDAAWAADIAATAPQLQHELAVRGAGPGGNTIDAAYIAPITDITVGAAYAGVVDGVKGDLSGQADQLEALIVSQHGTDAVGARNAFMAVALGDVASSKGSSPLARPR